MAYSFSVTETGAWNRITIVEVAIQIQHRARRYFIEGLNATINPAGPRQLQAIRLNYAWDRDVCENNSETGNYSIITALHILMLACVLASARQSALSEAVATRIVF